MIVEWNAHMFSADQERFPLHRDAPYRPELEEDPLRGYLRRMEEESIDRAVVVQPTPYWDDHRLILDCLRREPERLRGTCLFRSGDDGAPRAMRELVAAEPRIVAWRHHGMGGRGAALVERFDDWVLRQWREASELGLVVELLINGIYARAAADAIRRVPDCTVLLDHLCEPHTTSAVEYAHVLDLAGFDQVYMKLSGLDHFAPDPPLFESARPLTARVAEAFGPGRMVWGSGTPRIVDAHLESYSREERALVKGENLAALLGLG